MNASVLSPQVQSHSQAPAQDESPPAWHADFLVMLPHITKHAAYSFRYLKRENREEMVQEVIANACTAYARLEERGQTGVATRRTLAEYAVRQVRAGRKVGTSMNNADVYSPHRRGPGGKVVGSLSGHDQQAQEWDELILQDRRASPAEVATLRIDFREFLRTLSRRNRKLALKLTKGYETSSLAQQFKISAGRISQVRRELLEAWERFHEEPVSA